MGLGLKLKHLFGYCLIQPLSLPMILMPELSRCLYRNISQCSINVSNLEMGSGGLGVLNTRGVPSTETCASLVSMAET